MIEKYIECLTRFVGYVLQARGIIARLSVRKKRGGF